MKELALFAVFAPLAGALIAGLAGKRIGRTYAHSAAIYSVLLSFLCSCVILADVLGGNLFNGGIYTWATSGGTRFEVGFMIDRLSALMMVVVTFVSLMVHVYTIGYMAEDPGYQRFFSYIALFTFAMLTLVTANNFLQLFFGWEAVGLVSYLLIGFWYTRESAIAASLKAFLVNRIGDFGFLLGIGLLLANFGTLDYAAIFSNSGAFSEKTIEIVPGTPWSLLTVIGICLFIGAMGKSAQFPLHVWLPDSMEGPTPISALIHAATMVTAGIFMVARMSPLFELSQTARSVVLVVGAVTAFSMALVALTQYDIKRVVAYSTLSQLGYMTAALGATAYSAAIFHLMTHAFFKALLLLAAGSVIVALHHEQDMRRMGGLKKYMPITYWTLLLAAISSAGIPGFAGFFSKDAIIEAVHRSSTPGAGLAYLLVLVTVFITATYTFRLVFMAFHGRERFDAAHPPHESPAVITVPLVLLAIPSVFSGLFVGDVVYGDYFGNSLPVPKGDYQGLWSFVAHGFVSVPFWLALAGIAIAWFLYMKRTDLPARVAAAFGPLYALVERKYGFDELYAWLFAGGARAAGRGFWKGGDQVVIDGLLVNGSARLVGWFASVIRLFQTGFVYQYAFSMLIGVVILAFWFLKK